MIQANRARRYVSLHPHILAPILLGFDDSRRPLRSASLAWRITAYEGSPRNRLK